MTAIIDALAQADEAHVILPGWRPSDADLAAAATDANTASRLDGWRRHLAHELRDRRIRLAATEVALAAATAAGADSRTLFGLTGNHTAAVDDVAALEALLSATA
jgi:hypothetical protein